MLCAVRLAEGLAEQLVVDADGELARAGRLVDESTCTTDAPLCHGQVYSQASRRGFAGVDNGILEARGDEVPLRLPLPEQYVAARAVLVALA